MIDALFGSKTRVKLLHLFLNNPGKSFYVREITRLIDEQINSVRRELANMLKVGIITSDTSDNKLYYEVNQRYDHYVAFRAIFSDAGMPSVAKDATKRVSWKDELAALPGVRLVLLAGVFARGSSSDVDILIVTDKKSANVAKLVKSIEKQEGRDINYAVLPYDDFYYRLSIRDKFITGLTNGKYEIVTDVDGILQKGT